MTSPTMSAEERAKRAVGLWKDARGVDNVIPWEDNLLANAAEQIRQAEQAARADERRKTLEEAARVADGEQEYLSGNGYPGRAKSVSVIAFKIRALAQEPEEVG